MRRRNVAVVVGIVGVVAIVFFLPLIPVQVEPFCVPCAGLHIQEQGYASVALYLAGYGGIYMSGLPNYAPMYVGYCVVYGSPYSTSCGVGVGLLETT